MRTSAQDIVSVCIIHSCTRIRRHVKGQGPQSPSEVREEKWTCILGLGQKGNEALLANQILQMSCCQLQVCSSVTTSRHYIYQYHPLRRGSERPRGLGVVVEMSLLTKCKRIDMYVQIVYTIVTLQRNYFFSSWGSGFGVGSLNWTELLVHGKNSQYHQGLNLPPQACGRDQVQPVPTPHYRPQSS